MAPWPGFEPGSGHETSFARDVLRATAAYTDRTILPRLSWAKGAERDKCKFCLFKLILMNCDEEQTAYSRMNQENVQFEPKVQCIYRGRG